MCFESRKQSSVDRERDNPLFRIRDVQWAIPSHDSDVHQGHNPILEMYRLNCRLTLKQTRLKGRHICQKRECAVRECLEVSRRDRSWKRDSYKRTLILNWTSVTALWSSSTFFLVFFLFAILIICLNKCYEIYHFLSKSIRFHLRSHTYFDEKFLLRE